MSVSVQRSLSTTSFFSNHKMSTEMTGEGEDDSPAKRIEPKSVSVRSNLTNDSSSYCNSPTVDLGQDFERILKRCISERLLQQREHGCHDDSAAIETECDKLSTCSEPQGDDLVPEEVSVPDEETQNVNTEASPDEHIEENYDIQPDATKETPAFENQEEQSVNNSIETIVMDKEPKKDSTVPVKKKKTDIIIQEYYVQPKAKKDIKSKKRKEQGQGKKKKWQAVSLDTMGFEMSLCPYVQATISTTVTPDMENELQKFEEKCAKDTDTKDVQMPSTSHEVASTSKNDTPADCTSTPTDIVNLTIAELAEKSDMDDIDFVFHHYNTAALDVSLLLSNKDFELYDRFSGSLHADQRRLRRKKKWHTMKAGRQIKTKHCTEITNKVHGVKLFIKQRISKLMNMAIDNGRSKVKTSMRKIDKIYEKIQTESSCRLKANTYTGASRKPPASSNTRSTYTPRKDRTAPPPVYAMSAHNADGDFEADLVNILLTIQDRDLTPEDYELLLRLDERVKPKSIDSKFVSGLKVDSVTSEHIGESCAICIEEYDVGQQRKYLPCGHCFHEECTITWLKNSTTCPLDGLEVNVDS